MVRMRGEDTPRISIRGVAATVRTAPAVQRERFARDLFPWNDERLGLSALTGRQPDTDEEICIPVAQLAVMMEVEVPGAVAVLVRPPIDGHAMTSHARERDAQRDAVIAVDQQIIPGRARCAPNCKTHPANPRRNAALRKLVLI